MLIRDSLYQTRLPINCRDLVRSGDYPSHLCGSDGRFVLVRIHHFTMLSLQETPVQLCGGDGGTSSCQTLRKNQTDVHVTGLWKLQFPPDLPCHVPVADPQRSPLESRPE